MRLLGWLNITVTLAVLLALLWISPLAALVLALLLVVAVAGVHRLTPRGGVALRLRRGLRPGSSQRSDGRS